MLAADQLGDGVNLLGAEGDDGAARRQAAELAMPGMLQPRQTLADLDLDSGQKLADQGGHARRAQEQGLVAAARMEQAIGEDVASLRIGGQLDLVDRQELHVQRQRHGFDRADEVVRPRRDDLLLASDQGDCPHPARLGDPVIDLPRQQPQGQADHPRGVAQHALHRQVGLAGVGRAKHPDQTRGGAIVRRAAHAPDVGENPRSGNRPAGRA